MYIPNEEHLNFSFTIFENDAAVYSLTGELTKSDVDGIRAN